MAESIGMPGYIDPKDYFEERLDETLTDFGSMLFPGGAGQSLLQKLGISVASNMGKELVDLLGGTEKQKTGAKLGIMFMLDLATRGDARGHAGESLGEAERNIPDTDVIDATSFMDELNSLERRIMVGGVAPSDRPALQLIDQLRERVNQHTTTLGARELPAMNRHINEIRGNMGGFDLPRADRPQALHHINDVHGILGEAAIDPYSQANPAFGTPWEQGNQAYAVWAQSNIVTNYIQKTILNPLFLIALKCFFSHQLVMVVLEK